MRIALFGGTFDPPHRGHLAVARAALKAFSLEKIVFVPTANQPLKAHAMIASYEDRFAMVKRMCEGADAASGGGERFEASRLEAPVPGVRNAESRPNYTVDTLRRVRAEQGAGTKLFVILGADSFLDIRRWHEADALLGLAEWIVVSRPGFSLAKLDGLALTADERARVHLLETVHEDVSATEVRRRLAEGEDCSALLTPEVEAYIVQHRMYGKH